MVWSSFAKNHKKKPLIWRCSFLDYWITNDGTYDLRLGHHLASCTGSKAYVVEEDVKGNECRSNNMQLWCTTTCTQWGVSFRVCWKQQEIEERIRTRLRITQLLWWNIFPQRVVDRRMYRNTLNQFLWWWCNFNDYGWPSEKAAVPDQRINNLHNFVLHRGRFRRLVEWWLFPLFKTIMTCTCLSTCWTVVSQPLWQR